jgi:hypothetical protein
MVLPKDISFHTRWTNLEMTVPEGGAAPDASFRLDLTLQPAYSLTELQAVASSGTTLPGFDPVQLTLKPLTETKASLEPGIPRLHFPAPLKLPSHHPENGRRQVILMLRR